MIPEFIEGTVWEKIPPMDYSRVNKNGGEKKSSKWALENQL